MFLRALSIALWCAYTTALTPLSATGDDNDCALYLSGPGRTSAYDYSLNLLKGNFGYEGQHTCITYDAVNQAYLEARNRIVVSQPKGDWKPEDYASVGELILDISINLARKYGLTYEEIEKGLPLIDTSRTLIREVCPPVFSHVECRPGKYRRLDGLCNNLQHPTWGATNAPFQRLIGPLFADGINAPRISHTGRDLPLSRVVSRTMHPDEGFHDHAGTVMVIAWGQFMDHDYTLTGTPLDPVNRNDPEECCKRPPHLKHPYCNEIRVPEDDYFYRLFGVKCIDFVRGFPSPRPGCRLGSRVPFNTLTGVIDGNTVYGVTEKFARKLRTGYGGLLRMNPVFKEYGLKDLLPLKLDIPDEGCTRPNKNMYCFEAGEIRVNEQLVLTVMHTLMAREHNRVAKALAEVNPHWDDETLYQEARRINIAEIQHITYNEFLPILLGKDVMEKFGLVLEKEGYWDGFDPEVNPDVLDAFAAAAYRFGHSLLPTAVERWSKAHKFIASKRLSDLIRRPYDLYRAGVLDEYVMGLMNQVAQAMDDSITQEVTNHLFKKVGARFGMDLVSFNMQRGREFGLPGYMEFRKFCGLPGANSFQDLFGTMTNETVQKYESIFEHPIDVDLWSGGVSERPLPGSMLGPTFACIIATQFSYSRRGDRFWYELPNQPSTFTPEQLTEIRKARLARVICDNTDIIDTVQLYPMVLPDHELNPRVPCRSGIIPSMDFTKWAEPAPFHGAKQFMTDAQFSVKNDTNCEQKQSTTTTPNAIIADNDKESLIQDDNCLNITEISPTQNANLATLEFSCNNTVNNKTNNSNHEQNCAKNPTNEFLTESAVKNEIPDIDTVLKYVYKKNEKINVNKKIKPNSLNSLRRKRSTENSSKIENIAAVASNTAPLIVNYETNHAPRDIERALPLHERIQENSIKNSALADFNIETLHELSPSPKDSENLKENSSSQSYENSNEIQDKNSYRDESSSNSDESVEKKRYPENDDNAKKYSPNNEESNESSNRDDSAEKKESREKFKNEEYRKYSPKNGESNESSDRDNRESNESSNSENNGSDEIYKNNVNDEYRKDDEKSSNSQESQENIDNLKRKSDDGNFNKYRVKDHSPYHKASYSATQEQSEEEEEVPEKTVNENENANSAEDVDSKAKHTQDYYKKPERPRYGKIRDDSLESGEKEEHIKPKLDDISLEIVGKNQDDLSKSKEYISENSREDELQSSDNKRNSEYNSQPPTVHNDSANKQPPIQDVDLGDFSYERIQVNDKGQIVTAKENDEKEATIHTPSLQLQTTSKPEKQFSQFNEQPPLFQSQKDLGDTLNSNLFDRVKEPIEINDGEVKPVVEINAEISNNESKEENLNEAFKSNSEKEDNLETLLGTLIKDDLNAKNVELKEQEEKGDVKQQFERIPLNYKHDNKKTEENDQTANRKEQVSKSEDKEVKINHNEGTLDTFTPKDVNYDEHLKFKFDDISIKLPEIKLPDDVLAYEYEEQPYEKKKDKQNAKDRFYHYSDEVSEAPHESKAPYKNHEEDDDHGYYGYYEPEEKKQDYKKKEDDNDDDTVDLYEKFVRERFGKRGTFEKRAEKLQDARVIANPKLYERVQNILKHTEQTRQQAEKSGDPNAGYMWTLEYGEKL